MKVAILSGKGGTGKTFVSVNLAASAPRSTYVDCDVEEPDGHLFLKPEWENEETVSVKIPVVDAGLCDGCRECVGFCRFNALAHVGGKVLVFDDVCHSCGGCAIACPMEAISERDKPIGKIRRGTSGDVSVLSGTLKTGEASGIPIIRGLLSGETEGDVFIDCPPGSACTVMETIRDADYCILVAEPTLFGVYNLAMVYELVRMFGRPFGAVLNKCIDGENPAETYCAENGIAVLAKIPFDEDLGRINSNAGMAVEEDERFRDMFATLLARVRGAV